jgi:CheY-like chemotaxis protein
MRAKYKFLWIDDAKDRKNSLDTLKKRLSADGEFLYVSEKNITDEVDKVLSKSKFDLILIDHFLDNAKIKMGSTMAEYIREQRPDCPIVCVTAAGRATDIDFHKKSIYEDIFEVSSISNHYNTILSIAESYRKLVRKRPQKNDDLIKLMKVPKDVIEQIAIIIPEDIKRNYKDKSLLINISKWIRHELMSRPGFLYDDLWTATLIGIKKESLPKVKPLFEEAKYKGLFTDEDHPRWWQYKVRQLIYSIFPDDKNNFPWILGHGLENITTRDHSICYVCEKEFPETVGYTDEAANKLVPMHLRCSSIHPNFEVTLHFDDSRIMVPAR